MYFSQTLQEILRDISAENGVIKLELLALFTGLKLAARTMTILTDRDRAYATTRHHINAILALAHDSAQGITLTLRKELMIFVLEHINQSPVQRPLWKTPHFMPVAAYIRYATEKLRR